MGTKVDLTGKKFGRLTAIKEVGLSSQGTYNWLCVCECGKKKTVRGNLLTYGNNQSCGCLAAEVQKKRLTKHGYSHKTEYVIWGNMISRCYNPSATCFNNYGGRGVSVCDRWRYNFSYFLEDMGNRPSKNHSLDRYPNKNGNYEPGNVRWATRSEQSRNIRSNRWIEYNGNRMVLKDWSTLLGIHYMTLSYHLKTKTICEVIEFYKKKSK